MKKNQEKLIQLLSQKSGDTLLHNWTLSFENLKKILDEVSHVKVIKSLEDSDGLLIEQQLEGKRGWRTVIVDEFRVTVARWLSV